MKARFAALGIALVLSAAAPLADTLVLQNGRRIQGQLIGVYGGEIEFEQRNGGGRRVIRVPRADIARIEFEPEELDTPGRFGNRTDDATTGGIPRGMRERRVNVTAREPWTDTGVDVRAGQTVYFSADGEVRWGPNRRDGAAGERNSPSNPGRPLPDRPAASLIGRIGDGQDVFFIGDDSAPFRIRGAGRLYLGINDDVFTDNTGSLRVTVAY